MFSTRYTGATTSFKLQRPGSSDLNFTMPFSRDDFDINGRKGRDFAELQNKVIGFIPATYTIDDVDYDIEPSPLLFVYFNSQWYRWESTQERDGGGFLCVFTRADLNVAAYQANRR